jgi:hypothetical protein
MCAFIPYSYSNHFAVTGERVLVTNDWDVSLTSRAGLEALGYFTVESEELAFLMNTVCCF